MTINKQVVAREELPCAFATSSRPARTKTIFLKADPFLSYGDVVAVLDIVKGNGVERVGIVAQ